MSEEAEKIKAEANKLFVAGNFHAAEGSILLQLIGSFILFSCTTI